MRWTPTQARVAAVLTAKPDERHWGYQLCLDLGMPSATLYPMLTRFHDEGWLTDGWETPDRNLGRPPRHYYELTPTGKEALAHIADGHHPDPAHHGTPQGTPLTPDRSRTPKEKP